MRTLIASLISASPYSQSRNYALEHPKEEKESGDAYERRTWRYRTHTMPDGRIFIPPTSFKEALAGTAKYLSVQIPGKGKATYTKHFLAGVLVTQGPVLPITRDEIEGEWLYLNADGVKGSGKRVWRCMPRIADWKADVAFTVLDETITDDVFRYHLEQAGAFRGIGRFRPEKGGWYGRFQVDEVFRID